METSILTSTQRYAAAALFAVSLHQSQIHQARPSNPLVPLKEEPIGEGVTAGESLSVSDHPQLWIHENSGLLSPVLSFLGVDDQAWDGLKETAGVSSQARHHVRAYLTLLSEERDGTSAERMDKELSLAKAVDTMVLSMESSPDSVKDNSGSYEYGIKCREKYSNAKTESASDVTAEARETEMEMISKMSSEEELKSACGRTYGQALEEEKLLRYPRKVTVLYELLSACIADNTDAYKMVSKAKGYDARHRVALRLLSTWLNIKWIKVEAMERVLAGSVAASDHEQGVNSGQDRYSESPEAMLKRGGIIGAAAVTGGALMAITGGLAAPAIGQGLSALAPAVGASGFAAAAGATGSAAGSVAITSSFGAAGAGLAGSKMAKRVGSIEEFEFKVIGENHEQGKLAVGIMISGLVFEDEDFVKPWEGRKDNLERYALQWESKNLIALSTAIQDWLKSKFALELMKEGAMLTVLSTLLSALSLPATLVTASDLIDSKWAVAVDRSDKAGSMLAQVLLKGMQGSRPVTLIGFSLGARVIFKCLECLAETGDNTGLVERVVLLGAPISIESGNWENARKMVAGRFINAYSTRDWTLGIIFRASVLSQGVAGIQPVDISGIENVDVTDLIEGHSSYLWLTKQILEQLDLENYYPVSGTTNAKLQEQKSSATEFSPDK